VPVLLSSIVLCAALNAQTTVAAGGGISGVLTGDDGKAVDAVIRAARTSPLPAVVSSVKTTAGGAFQITGLPPGAYELCATAIAGGYVDPCLWEPSGVMVTLAAGQTATSTLTVKKASVLKVHVEDPNKLIKNSPEGAILMGVIAPGGHFHPVIAKNPDSSGNNYEISVPFDRDFRCPSRLPQRLRARRTFTGRCRTRKG
jgi:hypothetical protein